MKINFIFLLFFFITIITKGEERIYTGSTPADPVVRSFLGIALQDSVDFVRWQLTFQNNNYTLNCNYGIGKPNTNGFINNGKKIALTGLFNKEKNIYKLKNTNKTLSIVELNTNLLHILDTRNNMLIGNGGWSYTLNNIKPINTDAVNIRATQTIFKDSIEFEGRTPCAVPGVIPQGMQCYKLKWYIVLYANTQTGNAGTYKILGTQYRSQGGKTGSWKTIIGKGGRIVYRLNDDKENGFLYLLKLNENILMFTDAQGNLLVGNEDFSYTMNHVVHY